MTALSIRRTRCRVCSGVFLDIRHTGAPAEHCSVDCKRTANTLAQRRSRSGGAS